MMTPATSNDRDARRRWPFDVVLCVLFFGALAAPGIDSQVRPDSARDTLIEYRAPRPEPKWRWEVNWIEEFPAQYTSHFDDTWGLRDRLLRARNYAMLFGFGVSPASHMVLGTQGWWFLDDESSLAIHRGVQPFAHAELEMWRREFERHRDWCAERGMEWLFVIGPNKETIYPELLPERFAPIGPTRLEQLVEHLEQHSSVRIVDLRPALLEAKRECPLEEPLYCPLGTHWTSRGCIVVYREILRTLQRRWPELAPKGFEDFARRPAPESPDGWAARTYLGGALTVPNWNYEPLLPPRTVAGESITQPFLQRTASNPEKNLPRAFMFHDSYANEIDLLLAEHFSHFVWSFHYGFDAEVVAAAKPDVVIELFVERRLAFAPPVLALAQSNDVNRERFQASTRTLYRLDLAQEPCPIDGLAATRITREPGSLNLVLTTTNQADTFLLPAMPIPTDSSGVLHLSIDSPAKTVLDLLYMRESQTEYVRGNDFELPLQAGRTEIYFRFHLPDLSGRLRVRPRTPGKYVLHDLELRSIALD